MSQLCIIYFAKVTYFYIIPNNKNKKLMERRGISDFLLILPIV